MFKLKHKIILAAFSIAVTGWLIVVPGKSLAYKVNCPDGTTQETVNFDKPEQACASHQQSCQSLSTPDAIEHCQQDQQSSPGAATQGSGQSGSLGGFNNGSQAKNQCGGVATSLNLDCKGNGNPISQLLFSVIRFLSVGVGLVVIGSVIMAGIQFSTSQGAPAATAAAQKRLAATVSALFIYILLYAILNWLVPGGLFK